MHDIIKASIFAAIGVLVFASLLVPVVSDAMTDNGEPITKYNTDLYNRSTYVEVDGVDITYTASTSTFNVNGYEFTFGVQYDGNPLVIGKEFSLFMFNSTNRVTIELYTAESTTKYRHDLAYDATFTASNGEYTFSYVPVGTTTPDTYEGTYSGWMFAECAPDTPNEYVLFYSNGLNTHYVKGNLDDVIVLSSAITLAGNLGEYYSYRNGVETYTENMAVEWVLNSDNIQKVAGTTDIYNGYTLTATVNGTSQQITVMLPNEVKGHAPSGALYDMLGVLPIAVICVLIFGVLGAALYSRIE